MSQIMKHDNTKACNKKTLKIYEFFNHVRREQYSYNSTNFLCLETYAKLCMFGFIEVQ